MINPYIQKTLDVITIASQTQKYKINTYGKFILTVQWSFWYQQRYFKSIDSILELRGDVELFARRANLLHKNLPRGKYEVRSRPNFLFTKESNLEVTRSLDGNISRELFQDWQISAFIWSQTFKLTDSIYNLDTKTTSRQYFPTALNCSSRFLIVRKERP